MGVIIKRAAAMLGLFIVCGVLVSCSSWLTPNRTQALVEIKPGEYRLDPDHSSLLFKINHMGFSTFVGRFNQFDAELRYNATNIEGSHLRAVVNMASIDVNNEKFERALRGKFWLHAEQYPQAVFTTTSAKKVTSNTVIFTGDLQFMGVTQPVDVTVQFNGAANNLLTGKYTLGFAASTAFLRSHFGLDRYIPSVGDNVTLEIHAEFQRNAGGKNGE